MVLLLPLLCGILWASDTLSICTGRADAPKVLLLQAFMSEAYADIGVHIEMKHYPWKRSLMVAAEGGCDAELCRLPLIEPLYQSLVRVPEPLVSVRFFVVSADSAMAAPTWEQLRAKRIGIQRGIAYLEQKSASMRVTKLDDLEEIHKLLSERRVDCYVGTEAGIKRMGNDFLEGFSVSTLPLDSAQLYHYLHESNRALLEPLCKSIRALKKAGRIGQLRDSLQQ